MPVAISLSAPPLSHHELLGWVEPFARAGRRVDLAGSDRAARKLVFQPHTLGAGQARAWVERLVVESPEPGRFVLSRRLASGPEPSPEASLVASGGDLAALFALVQAVPPERQFLGGAQWSAALHHQIGPEPKVARPAARFIRTAEPLIAHADAKVDPNAEAKLNPARLPALSLTHADMAVLGASGLRLSLKLPSVKGYPAELTLHAGSAGPQALPSDLLAVLGSGCSQLDRYGAVWRCSLRLPGTPHERSRAAERWLADIGAHLALTLSEPPARFHERLAGRRWRLAARRTLPLLTLCGLVGAALAVPSLGIAEDSVWRMLLLNSPPLLLAFGVSLRELPRFELPRWPRPPKPTAWAAPTSTGSASPSSTRACTA